MKVGNKLYCHNNYKQALTIGNVYTILELQNGEYWIDDDDGSYVYFKLYDWDAFYYAKWFYSEKEYRKLKLEKLNESRR